MTGPALQTPGERTDCSISGAESTGHPHRKQCKASPTHTLQTVSAKWTLDSNENDSNLKLSEHLRVGLCGVGVVKYTKMQKHRLQMKRLIHSTTLK